MAKYAEQVIGVDISAEAVCWATDKYHMNNLKYIQGNAIDIPLDDKSVDVVVSFETIEHHDKHKEMMQEIKRVLKTNGILIISSPDKYYYSDVPNFKNEFHVKELYYEEFKSLISIHFKKTFFYSQIIFVGSIIALDENTHEFKKPLVIDKGGSSSEFNPIYNIAIATDNINYIPDNQLILYKENDDILTELDIQIAIQTTIQTVRNTIAFRLGKFILKPFSYFRNKFNNQQR